MIYCAYKIIKFRGIDMKSSTIRRSNLSKEKMAVIDALAKYRQESYDESPNVYVRPEQNKEQELDILWQNFKVHQKSDKSPNVYLATGFIAGALSMLVLVTLISFSARGISSVANSDPAPAKAKVKKEKVENVNFIPATTATAATAASETYSVQSGDTIESIQVRFYGAYSKDKQELIARANNLKNPNRLSIGQKLIIPMQ